MLIWLPTFVVNRGVCAIWRNVSDLSLTLVEGKEWSVCVCGGGGCF